MVHFNFDGTVMAIRRKVLPLSSLISYHISLKRLVIFLTGHPKSVYYHCAIEYFIALTFVLGLEFISGGSIRETVTTGVHCCMYTGNVRSLLLSLMLLPLPFEFDTTLINIQCISTSSMYVIIIRLLLH